MTVLSRLCVAALAAALAGCGEEIFRPGPPGTSRSLRLDDTVTVDLAGSAEPLVFRFRPGSQVYLAIYLEALTGATQVQVLDSARGFVVAHTSATTGSGRTLLDNRTQLFVARPREVFHVVVDQPDQDQRGQARLLAHRVRREPESRAERISPGDTITGETLEPSADIDDFVFTATAGQQVIVFLEGPASVPTGGLVAGVYDDTIAPFGDRLGGVANGPPSDDLEASASGRITLAAAGDHYLSVLFSLLPFGTTAADLADPYRVVLLPIERGPERVAAALVRGDTLSGEAIDHVGDVDEYTFARPTGSGVNVFFQVTGTPVNGLRLEAPDGSLFPVGVESRAGDTALTRQATGTVMVPSGGVLRVRVEGLSDRALDRGGYRLFPYAVNRAPESGGGPLAPGDSAVGETIELPGDVDEWLFTVPVAASVNLWLTGLVPPTNALRLQLETLGGAPLRSITLFESASPEGGIGSGPAPVAAGSYRLRVVGGSSRGEGFRGAYRLFTAAVDSTPEGVSAAIAPGDTIGESAEPLGDTDYYTFSGRRGQVLRATFTDPGVPAGAGVDLFVADSTGWPPLGAAYSGAPFAPIPTARMILPRDGTYRVRVGPVNGGRVVSERGPYRFTIVEQSTAPETAGAALVPGDSVGAERLDAPGDVDDYLLTAPPGAELQTFIDRPPNEPAMVEVLDVDSYEVLRSTLTAGWPEATGLTTIPAGGRVRVRVYAPRLPECLTATPQCEGTADAPYSLWVYAISRAPEVGPALIAVGDTVVEAVNPGGDIDEFQFDAAADDTVEVYFQTPTGFGFPPAVLELVDDVTGAVLGSVTSLNPTPMLEDQTTGTVVLPRTDRYRVRVRCVEDTENTGDYRFRVVRRGA